MVEVGGSAAECVVAEGCACCGRGLCMLRQRAVAAAANAEVGGRGKVWQGALRLLGAGIWRAYEGGPPNAKAAQHGAKSKKSKVRIVIARNRIDQKSF